MNQTLAELREEYAFEPLSKKDVDPDPIVQFQRWFEQALTTKVPDLNSMLLSTATPDGKPSARVVLLKDFDATGFVFYTNYQSRKGKELEQNPQAALTCWWGALGRQVRIEGHVTKVAQKTSDHYFKTRPRGSQLSAWASNQSETIENREVLEARLAEFAEKFINQDVPRPPHWGGFCLEPHTIEFWQGRPNRLHDRIVYRKATGTHWDIVRLSP